jgi:hypothetical protein
MQVIAYDGHVFVEGEVFFYIDVKVQFFLYSEAKDSQGGERFRDARGLESCLWVDGASAVREVAQTEGRGENQRLGILLSIAGRGKDRDGNSGGIIAAHDLLGDFFAIATQMGGEDELREVCVEILIAAESWHGLQAFANGRRLNALGVCFYP